MNKLSVMRYHLKITIRNLKKNPVFGFVIIAGFTFSLSITLLLASYIFNESDYDKSFPEINNIYRLCAEKGITTFRGDKINELKDKYPEIERICRYDNRSAEMEKYYIKVIRFTNSEVENKIDNVINIIENEAFSRIQSPPWGI